MGLVALILGATLARASSPYGMVDPIAPGDEASYQTYLDRCASCHVAIPPALLPTQTWQTLVTDTAHYGLVLPTLSRFDQQLMINYLQTYSRPHRGNGPLPYRLSASPYFQALHPPLALSQPLPQPLTLSSCLSCHAHADQQDYTRQEASTAGPLEPLALPQQ